MEQVRVTFFFRVGQMVRWKTPTGPRYLVRQRRYVEGEGVGRYEYLLTDWYRQGFDFWAPEGSLLRDMERWP